MICWWCSRCCHFFPSSSAAQNQLSAPTAMKFLGMNVPQENNQKAADSSADFAAQLKNIHIEVLNSRYDLLFFFPEENDVDGALNTERNALYLGTEDNRSTVEPASERNFERANTSFYVDHDERSVAEIDKYETWINIAYAFDGSKDKDWFRSSIKLLTELCKGISLF